MSDLSRSDEHLAAVRAAALEMSIHNLDQDPSVICSVDRNLNMAYCNQTWDRFAAENGGVNLDGRSIEGKPILGFITPRLRDYYQRTFEAVAARGEPWEHAYECSSPTHFRVFHMWIRPLRHSGGLLMVHSLRVSRAHGSERPKTPALDAVYLSEDRILTMCSHCRRSRRVSGDSWDWVPEYLNQPPAPVSHGLCPQCIEYFYPELTT